MKFKTIERLETERMTARRIQSSDFENLYRLHNDPEVAKTLGGPRTETQIKTSLEQIEQQWQTYGYCYWIFFDKKTEQFVGRGGLRHVSIEGKDEVEVGYAVMPTFWRQGYATEMGQAAIIVATENLHLPELICFTLITNIVSQRIMEKLGFSYERDFIYANLNHQLYRKQLVNNKP
jgi:ribosomal-protein-alanine N-acetyltransferase